jgi:hypothetical protein
LFHRIGENITIRLCQLQARTHADKLPGVVMAEALRAAQFFAYLDIRKEIVLPRIQIAMRVLLRYAAQRAALLRASV